MKKQRMKLADFKNLETRNVDLSKITGGILGECHGTACNDAGVCITVSEYDVKCEN